MYECSLSDPDGVLVRVGWPSRAAHRLTAALNHLWTGTGYGSNLAYDNVTYANGDHGIDVHNAVDARVIANTIYANYDSGIEMTTSISSLLANNISVDNGLNNVRTSGDIHVDKRRGPDYHPERRPGLPLRTGRRVDWGSVKYTSSEDCCQQLLYGANMSMRSPTVTDAVLLASRALVGVAARSLAEVEDRSRCPSSGCSSSSRPGTETSASWPRRSTFIRPARPASAPPRSQGPDHATPAAGEPARARGELTRRADGRRTVTSGAGANRPNHLPHPGPRTAGVVHALGVFAEAAGEIPEPVVVVRLGASGDVGSSAGPRAAGVIVDAFAVRSRQVLLFAALIGVITGFGVALSRRSWSRASSIAARTPAVGARVHAGGGLDRSPRLRCVGRARRSGDDRRVPPGVPRSRRRG